MSRRLVGITLDTLEDLPRRCRRCVFWELDPVARDRAEEAGGTDLEKEAWVSSVLLQWGSCGSLVYVDGVPAGYALVAPPAYLPRSVAFPTSPAGPDSVVLAGFHVLPEFAGGGLGRLLVQHLVKDMAKRGVRAIEAFADLRWTGPACVLPADFLLSVGFKTVRPHPRWPRLRLEVRSTVSWRSDVEHALERLLGSMAPPVGLTGASRAADEPARATPGLRSTRGSS